jgi:hypothetical protein
MVPFMRIAWWTAQISPIGIDASFVNVPMLPLRVLPPLSAPFSASVIRVVLPALGFLAITIVLMIVCAKHALDSRLSARWRL